MADGRRELFERIVDAMSRRDWDALEELHHPDFVEDVPQARERVRGFANLRKILENYPGGVGGDLIAGARLIAEERWAVTPTFTVVNVSGQSDMLTAIIRARYPDGSWWYIVTLGQLKDGKLWRSTTFYAPEYASPEWRAPWVERLDDEEALADAEAPRRG